MPLRRLFLIALAFVLVSLVQREAGAVQPERSGQGSFLTRAVAAHKLLWTLSDVGVLSTVKLDSRLKERQHVDGPVLDLCVRANDPEISLAARHRNAWTIEHFANDKWSVDGTVPQQRDSFIALACDGNDLTVLTSRRVIAIHRGAQRDVMLSKKLFRPDVASVFSEGRDVFVGLNAGEWGGGLLRINMQTGNVRLVDYRATRAICDGPLNTDCDPVTAISADPWNRNCVLVAIGLEHMMSHGRIDEICNAKVRIFYNKADPHIAPINCKHPSGEPCETVAFFGLARHGNQLLAVGSNGLYRINKDGTAAYSPFPKFIAVGDIDVSYGIPGFVLVLTDVNKRLSLSDSVPLLIPR